MSIHVTRDRSGKMRHVVAVREHRFAVDEGPANGGDDAGPTPHDLYDAALGACKALTVLWYAQRKGMPVEDIAVTVDRDASEERAGVYRLRATLALSTGPVRDAYGREFATFTSIWRLEAPGVWRIVFDKGDDTCDCPRR